MDATQLLWFMVSSIPCYVHWSVKQDPEEITTSIPAHSLTVIKSLQSWNQWLSQEKLFLNKQCAELDAVISPGILLFCNH